MEIQPSQIDFESKIFYADLEQFPNNKKFKIPCWKTEKNDCNEVLIMINGFLEGVLYQQEENPVNRARKIDKQLRRYNSIANESIKNNIVSVLMPLPFHFSRGEDYTIRAPIKRLVEKGHGSYLYYGGFDQIIQDVNDLISRIKKSPNDFGLDSTKELKFHILGYSIGGVATMGCALKLEHKFESMSILLSSWNLNAISSDAIHELFQTNYQLGKSEWEQIKSELNNELDHNIIDPEFNFLWRGIEDENNPLREKLENKVGKILFINGNHDSLFTQEMATQRAKYLTEKEFKNVTFIAVDATHWALSPKDQSTNMIPKFIATFIAG